jgi:hypothetical protein
MNIAQELKEIGSEFESFNGSQRAERKTSGPSGLDVQRSVLDAARKFQDDTAKAGPKSSGRFRQSVTYTVGLESMAAGCHSGQVKEFNEMYKSAGVIGAYHKPDGVCVFESNRARNEVLKIRGLYDRDGGYGQWAGEAKDD